MTCYKGPEGNAFEHKVAVATESLNPPHRYAPWITVDGVHDAQKEDAIGDSLLNFVCENYKGPNKSKDCPSSDQKVFRKAYFEKCPVESNLFL